MGKRVKRISVLIMVGCFFLSWIEHFVERFLSFSGISTPVWLVVYVTVLLFTYTIIHAILNLGTRSFFLFLLITIVIAFFIELLKVKSGFILYGQLMGPSFLGIPLLLPLWFFILIYSAYSTTNLILDIPLPSQKVSLIAFLSIFDSVVLTSWFTMEDAINVTLGSWRWARSGDYFGSPIIIFPIWVLSAFCVSFFYRLIERRFVPSSRLNNKFALARHLPFFSYSWLNLSAMVGTVAVKMSGTMVVGLFTTLPFMLAGLWRLNNKKFIKEIEK